MSYICIVIKKEIKMKAKVGQYFFRMHHGSWGIFQWDSVEDGYSSASHIKDEWSFEEALRETYRLNGWNQPKRIVRAF